MLGVGLLRCFFFFGIMCWYTTSVWQTIDQYFRDQFRDYLQKEFESNEQIRKDVMMEAERIAIQKALIKKFGKMDFAKELDTGGNKFPNTLRRRQKFGQTEEVVREEYHGGVIPDGEGIIARGTMRNVGPEGTGDPGVTMGMVHLDASIGPVEDTASEGMVGIYGQDVTIGTEDAKGMIEISELKEEAKDEELAAQSRYNFLEEECRVDECGETVEQGKELHNWKDRFLEDEDVCRLDDLGKKDSCAGP